MKIINPMTHSSSSDFDGDQFGHIKSYGEIANESVLRIKKAKTFAEKCELVVQLADISKRQMRNMSHRRKKLAVRRYSRLSGYYDTTTGVLVNNTKWRHKNVKMIPLIVKFEEKVGKPMSDLLDAWVKSL